MRPMHNSEDIRMAKEKKKRKEKNECRFYRLLFCLDRSLLRFFKEFLVDVLHGHDSGTGLKLWAPRKTCQKPPTSIQL